MKPLLFPFAALALALLAGCVGRDLLPTDQQTPPHHTRPHHAPAIMASPEAETGGTGLAIVTSDGTHLPLRRWMPDGTPRAIVLGLHGFNDYSASFNVPATWWAEQGIAVYAYDQRGHGATSHPGHWPGIEPLVADARLAANLLASRHPGIPIFLLGESMGGAVAILSRVPPQDGLGAAEIDGLILVAPAIANPSAFPLYQRWGLALVSHLAPGLRFTGENLDLQPSDNIEILVEMWHDPLVLKDARADTLAGLLDVTTRAAGHIGWIAPPQPGDTPRPPTLMVFGGREDVVRLDWVGPVLTPQRARWQADASWRLGYYEAGHHMLLRDLEAEAIWADILAWISAPQAPLPSGAEKGAWPCVTKGQCPPITKSGLSPD